MNDHQTALTDTKKLVVTEPVLDLATARGGSLAIADIK